MSMGEYTNYHNCEKCDIEVCQFKGEKNTFKSFCPWKNGNAHFIDCNDCKNINITEKEQRKQNLIGHTCTYYVEKLFHKNIEKEASYIHPCIECVAHGYKNFVPRNQMTQLRMVENPRLDSLLTECEEKQSKVTLLEYAESISPFPLTSVQKEILQKCEEAIENDEQLVVMGGRHQGRMFIKRVFDEWKTQNELREHRCQCGRLLGKFNGQAEIKCPKCGKMNVIGVEK